jgi:HK97 family phage portal protein
MALISNLRRNLARKSVTIGSFTTTSAGEEYLRNGYYGIYREAYGGGISTALGAQVSENRALSLSAFYAGVKIISEDVGSCPLLTLEKQGMKQREAPEHPMYPRLLYAPNPDMTAMQFRETLTGHAIMCGTGYARKEYSAGDSERIIALWPLMPYEIRRDVDQRQRPVYIVSRGTEPAKTYEPKAIFKLSGFGLTGYDGLNLMEYARNILGLSLAQEEYAGRFFSQDQTPNLVLKHPARLGAEGIQGVKDAWLGRRKDGTRKTVQESWHEPKVLQEGMGIEQIHPDNQRSQLVEQRVFQLLEVCRILRMPPHKLAELGRATWANIGDENQSYYTGSLRPWFVRWEQSLKLQCFGVDTPYFAEHDPEDLIRGDYKTQSESLAKLQEKGTISINEARALLNYNPIEGGDEHFIQLNMGTLGNVANPPAANPQLVRVGAKQ